MAQAAMVGTGVQPKDNPPPDVGAAADEILGGGGAPAGKAPSPPPAGASTSPHDYDAEANDVLGGAAQSVGQGEPQGPQEEPHTPLLERVKQRLEDEMQMAKAKFRMGAARNDTEEHTALEKAFGKDNVRFNGKNNVLIRPEGSKTWRKFDESDFLKFAEPFMDFGTRVALQNMPEMLAKSPELAAQAGVTTAGAVAGAAVGNVPGAIIGGGVGGVMGSKLGKQGQQLLAEGLDQADPNFKYDNKIKDTASFFSNDYVQGVMGAVTGGLASLPVMKAAARAATASRVGQEAASAIEKLAPEQLQFGQWVSSLKTYASHFFPSAETAGTKAGLSASEDAMGVVNKSMEDLGQRIDLLKDEASRLQRETGNYLKADNFTQAVREEMSKHGVVFGDTGQVNREATRLSATAPSSAQKLLDLNDEAVAYRFSRDGGMSADRAEQFLNTLENMAQYEKQNVQPNSSPELFRTMRKALSADRAEHYSQLFGGENTVESKLFKQSMAEYSNNIESYKTINRMFSSPQDVELMAKKISGQGSPQALEAMDSFRQILGSSSNEWKNLRGEVLNRFIDRATADGKINAKALSSIISNPDNDALMERLFEGDKKSMGVFKTIVSQGQTLQDMNETPKGLASALIRGAADLAVEHIPGGRFVKMMNGLSNGNKIVIDHTNEALLDAIKKVSGPEQKKAMLEALGALDSFRKGSEIVSVPLPKAGAKEYVQRYVPTTVGVATGRATGKGLIQENKTLNASQPPPAE